MDRVRIDGVEYVPLQEVLRKIDVSRQTLWRWRKHEEIPAGRRHPRSGQVLFTADEFEEIRSFADRLEPLDSAIDHSQIHLFSSTDGKSPK